MTIWIWIIGLFALVWPVFVSWFAGSTVDEAQLKNFEALKAASTQDLRKLFGAMREKDEQILELKRQIEVVEEGRDLSTSGLAAVIKEQDQLIAALWAKVHGIHSEPGYYLGDEFVTEPEGSPKPLRKAWGINPPWQLEVDEVLSGDRFVSEEALVREDNYPWGLAEPLHERQED